MYFNVDVRNIIINNVINIKVIYLSTIALK